MEGYNYYLQKAQEHHKCQELAEAEFNYCVAARKALDDSSVDDTERIQRAVDIMDILAVICPWDKALVELMVDVISQLEQSNDFGKKHPQTIDAYLTLLRCWEDHWPATEILERLEYLIENLQSMSLEEARDPDVIRSEVWYRLDRLSAREEFREDSLALQRLLPSWLQSETKKVEPEDAVIAMSAETPIRSDTRVQASQGGSVAHTPEQRQDTYNTKEIVPDQLATASPDLLEGTTKLDVPIRNAGESKMEEKLPNASAQMNDRGPSNTENSEIANEDRKGSNTQATRTDESKTRASSRARRRDPSNAQAFGNDDRPERLADRWFCDLERKTHPITGDGKYAATDAGPYDRVKIMIMDTGIAKAQHRPDLVDDHLERIRGGQAFGESRNWEIDTDGHGTHVAILTAKTCPNADLYIAKVATDGKVYKKEAVVEALKWAMEKKMDIVNMSFGWTNVDIGELGSTLDEARRQGIILFAATSNYGVRSPNGVAYPASSPHVIGVDCANGAGTSTRDFNPASNFSNPMAWRFTAVGMGVESAYPTNKAEDGVARLDGTSSSSAIAAGIAGLVLDFARQEPLSFEPEIARLLKSQEKMMWTFHDHLSEKQESWAPFNFLMPWKLWECERDSNGDAIYSTAHASGEPRREAAEKIVQSLRAPGRVERALLGKRFYSQFDNRR